ncbi:MAG TPA: polymer-forming cytoskeletal protein [Thermoanaerobaculaceae bacterium]|mgnify:FL=1|nr:polymer-forming cytoskeletal protein [Thermoanaerobaculaceae bacterium]HRS17789.1 polymer-forming cytoskeletal protein [Thermoanaerobaculaceae bacterium]
MKKAPGTLNGFLDQGCSIKGEIAFTDLLRVHGHASGTVTSEGELLVGEGGVVEGEVSVGRLVVAGAVRGIVRVRERLTVHGSGKVEADITTPVLVVDEGGVVEGKVTMAAPAPRPTLATPSATKA